MDLNVDSKIGGQFNILNEANHGSHGDPHSQYVNIKPTTKAPQSGTNGNQWFKILTIMTNEYTYSPYMVGEIELFGGNANIELFQYAKFKFSFKHRASKKETKIDIAIDNSSNMMGMKLEDLKIVLIKEEEEEKQVEIWFKVNNDWDEICFRPLFINTYRCFYRLDGNEYKNECPVGIKNVSARVVKEFIMGNDDNKSFNKVLKPTLKNGWQHHSFSGDLIFTRNPFGQVVMQGTISGGISLNATEICTLSKEYYPQIPLLIPVWGFDNSWNPINGFLRLGKYGELTVDKLPKDIMFLTLSGFTYAT